MSIRILSGLVSLALALVIAPVHAQAPTLAFEPGIDQEIVTALQAPGSPPLLVQRRFLEPRKAKTDPQRAATDELRLMDASARNASPLVSYPADALLWIGPARRTGAAVAFTLRTGASAPTAYQVGAAVGAPQRLTLPWEREAKGKAAAYERLFLISDAVVAARSEMGVYSADLWLGDSPKALPLDTSIEKGDGRRVLAIDDVAELDGRIVLLLNVVSGQGEGQGEIWLLSFDRSFTRAAARALRLETGAFVSATAEFVRSASGVTGVRVLQRTSAFGRPTLKLFPPSGPASLWRYELPRVDGAGNIAAAGVCKRSFLVLRSRETEPREPREAEWILVGPTGQEAFVSRQPMPKGTVLTKMVLAVDRDQVWSYINFSRLENERRADGWYSWRGYQGQASPASQYCKFE